MDLQPQHSPPPNGELLIHYGTPVVTSSNTLLMPVKTGATDGFGSRRDTPTQRSSSSHQITRHV